MGDAIFLDHNIHTVRQPVSRRAIVAGDVLYNQSRMYVAYITKLRRRTDTRPAQASQGLRTPTPVRSKSATFLVATVRPCTRAVAAMRASRSERGFGT